MESTETCPGIMAWAGGALGEETPGELSYLVNWAGLLVRRERSGDGWGYQSLDELTKEIHIKLFCSSFFEISFLCINPEIRFKTCNSGWKVDTAAYCSLAPLFKFHALEATWDTFSWEIPLKKTSGETVCLSLVHSTWLHYKACASNRNLCIIVRPLGRLLAAQLCDLLPNCTHKWVEEQERNYGVQATLGCMLPAGEGYPEQSQ